MNLDRNTIELEAALFQAAVTAGLAVLFGLLYRRYRRPYLAWWACSWVLYTIRVGLIVTFLLTTDRVWLYLHQVVTGWTALTLLGAALSFDRTVPIGRRYLLLGVLPVVWSLFTIYVLDSFLLAASLTVLLLSGATAWTGFVLLRFRRRTDSTAAGLLAAVLILWAIHHLDYPLLRAQGLLAPWSYFIDTTLILALGAGVLLLLLEELHRGLRTLSTLSGDLHRSREPDAGPPKLLERVLGLAGIAGSGLWSSEPPPAGRFTHGIGVCAGWVKAMPGGELESVIAAVRATAAPKVLADFPVLDDGRTERVPFVAVIPMTPARGAGGVVVIAGRAREPFTALDQDYLVALGQQIGGALENSELERRLRERTADLERLSIRLIQQHEDQRRRLARELHDETAQVFSAMKLQLGLLKENAGPSAVPRVEVVTGLVETGMRSIRSVVEDLRPTVLDDLGIGAALQAMISDFRDQCGVEVSFAPPEAPLPRLSDDAELAIFRALQEALSNVARHSGANRVEVELGLTAGGVRLRVRDDGHGAVAEALAGPGRMGLAGMQERLAGVGGRLAVTSTSAGTELIATVPAGLETAP